MNRTFRIAVTADFFDEAGRPKYRDLGLSVLDEAAGVVHAPLAEYQAELQAAQLGGGVNALLVLAPRVTRNSLAASGDLLAVARFGVGYDSVDVAACTDHDVVLTIARGAVDRPVAEATVGWMLALGHHVKIKDRLTRELRWHDRSQHMGWELRERTLGIIGFGGIAREIVRLLGPFGLRETLVFDPYYDPEAAPIVGRTSGSSKMGDEAELRPTVRKVALDELLAAADIVSVHCPLTPETRGLLGPRELSLMKPTAVLINTARGNIVDEAALVAALRDGRLAGAAIDCFATEPLAERHPLAEFDNVLLAPHAIAWTDELFRDIGRTACGSLVDLAHGRRPHGVVNPEVFERPTFQAKWRRLSLPK
jgi:phosphoglycerate dehydrogenase-like enzyme